MRFAQISTVLLGLAAFASALPNPNERRMVWTPRSLERKDESGSKHNKDSIAIIDTTVVELTEASRNSEIELTVLVQEKIKIEEQKKTAKDNVRKNHYRNKNRDVVCYLSHPSKKCLKQTYLTSHLEHNHHSNHRDH
jgi:hypothetical protein